MEVPDHPVDAIFQQLGRMQQALGVRSWPFWKLPRTLAAFVAAVILADLAVFAAAAAAVPVSVHDLEVFALLLACNAATVELTRRGSEPEGHVKDMYAVWELKVRSHLRTVSAVGQSQAVSMWAWPIADSSWTKVAL